VEDGRLSRQRRKYSLLTVALVRVRGGEVGYCVQGLMSDLPHVEAPSRDDQMTFIIESELYWPQ